MQMAGMTTGGPTNVPGYQNLSYGQAYIPPPPPMEQPTPPEHQNINFNQDASLTEEEAREHLLEFANQNCCYGSRPAKEMKVTEITPFSTYHYVLESYCEARETKLQCEPFRGQPIDGPDNGMAPSPWAIPAQPRALFENMEIKIEVPHTAIVKPCHACKANGYKRCNVCDGRCTFECPRCNGNGYYTVTEYEETRTEECTTCFGSGRRDCDNCHGTGDVKCSTCDGHKYVKNFIELTVKWQNRKDERMLKRTNEIPDEVIRSSEGTQLFSQEQQRVWPLTTFPEAEVNQFSKELIHRHATQFTSERILMQRHNLRQIPVSEVLYKYKEKLYKFMVCGHQHQVYAPDYPEKCCCGCCGCVLL